MCDFVASSPDPLHNVITDARRNAEEQRCEPKVCINNINILYDLHVTLGYNCIR